MPGSPEKMRHIPYLRTRQIAMIVLAGALVRLAFGLLAKAWLGSPDQLAWGLDLDEMISSKNWTYQQLTHAPHEGASFFISLISLLFRPLQSFLPPLTCVALLVDALGRFLQIRITQKLFGNETATWFGWWSVLAVPLLIPWATVNFGLHALLSFIPFVFCWIVFKYQRSVYFPLICGIVCGIAISLSYNSIVLAAAAFFFFIVDKKEVQQKIKNSLVFAIVLAVALLPHLFTRIYLYDGIPVENTFSIRGLPLDNFLNEQHIINLYSVWFTSLPGSLLLLPGRFFCGTVFLFLLAGITFYFSRTTLHKKNKYLPAVILFSFMAVYAFSPFYGKDFGNTNYVYYRHLCYIIPLLIVIVINGFITTGSWKKYVLAAWLFSCGIASVHYIFAAEQPVPVYKAAGWVLVNKYGENMDKLFSIHSVTPIKYQDELLAGIGWGLAARLLKENNTTAVDKLVALIRKSPQPFQQRLAEGVRHAFVKGVTPVLNSSLLSTIDSGLAIKNYTNP